MPTIESRENPRIKEYVKLSKSASRRKKEKSFVIEGSRLADDARKSGITLLDVFVTDDAYAKSRTACLKLKDAAHGFYSISDRVAASIAGTKTPQGIFCTAKIPENGLIVDNIDTNGIYLALENIQDPGNMGAMMRTAEAFGFDGVLLSSGCTDVFSPKTVRASMGAVFRIRTVTAEDLSATLVELSKKGMATAAAVTDSDAGPVEGLPPDCGIAVAIGNEGNGLSPECRKSCSKKVTIHMRGRAESLNAASAATIIMWEISKKRRRH